MLARTGLTVVTTPEAVLAVRWAGRWVASVGGAIRYASDTVRRRRPRTTLCCPI